MKNNYQAQIDALAVKGGYRKWISYLSFLSVIPYGVIFYTTRTLMADEAVIAEGGGGCLWFPVITAADSTYALPLLSWLFMSATSEMTMAQSNPARASNYLMQKWGSRLGTAFFLVMFRGSEAGIMLGFVVSGLMNALPPLILRTKWFREKFSVPRIKPPPRSNMVWLPCASRLHMTQQQLHPGRISARPIASSSASGSGWSVRPSKRTRRWAVAWDRLHTRRTAKSRTSRHSKSSRRDSRHARSRTESEGPALLRGCVT